MSALSLYWAAERIAGDLLLDPDAVEAGLLEQWRGAYRAKLDREPEGAEVEAARAVLRRRLGAPLDPPASASGLAWARVPELVHLRDIVDGAQGGQP